MLVRRKIRKAEEREKGENERKGMAACVSVRVRKGEKFVTTVYITKCSRVRR